MEESHTTANVGGPAEEEDLSYVPKIGKTFDTEEEVHNFYNMYAQIIGFSTRIQYTKRTKGDKIILSRTYVCGKEGYRKPDKRDHMVQNPTAETRIGCRALLRVRLNKDTTKYEIYDFVAVHNNHPLLENVLSHMLPSHRKISQARATEIELAADSGIDLRLAHELIGKESGGRECIGFLKRDHKNYLRTRRQKMLAFGEVGIISNYFLEKRQENPSFYHDMQLDNEERITNIFWADASMISDYQNFGDSVSFDTTYKINSENRPFAVFVGFNNHRETIVFGAALMYDETADSFKWLFQTFLKAMSNKHPKTIFTDQDAAMAKAISFFMPNTYHRLCRWHMMQNAFKHVGSIFKGPDGVRGTLAPFFDDYEDELEFVKAWETLLANHSLENNSWLRSIFDLRIKWGRPYVRWSWSAGMKSTQLSESLNSTLKDYLRSDYNLGQFFTHFDRALENIRYNEKDAAFSLAYKLPKLKMKSIQMLVQTGELYTTTIFNEFQEEFESSIQLHVSERHERNGLSMYTVTSPLHSKPRKVIREEQDVLRCECRLFEMRGVVCMHLLKVLRDELCLLQLPDHYILKRWTKKARAEIVTDWTGREIDVDPKLARNTRFKELATKLIKLAGRACETEITSDILRKMAKEASKDVEEVLHSFTYNEKVQPHREEVAEESRENVVHAKGLKKKPHSGPRGRRRIIGSLEKALVSKRRKIGRQGAVDGRSIPDNSTPDLSLAQGTQDEGCIPYNCTPNLTLEQGAPYGRSIPYNREPDLSLAQGTQDEGCIPYTCTPNLTLEKELQWYDLQWTPSENFLLYSCTPEQNLSQASQMTGALQRQSSQVHLNDNENWPVDRSALHDGSPHVQLSDDTSLMNGRNKFDLNEVFDNFTTM